MKILTRAALHVGGVATQAALLAALVGVLALVFSPVYGPARTLTGADGAAAGRANKGTVTVADGHFGGTTTATLNPGGAGTWGYAACYQDGKWVYGQYVKNDGSNVVTFKLGPTPSWTGGYASCVAQEGTFSNGRWRVMAEAKFNAWE